jgi:hypothetical protein
MPRIDEEVRPEPGAAVWVFKDCHLWSGIITDRRTVLEGDPLAFDVFTVREDGSEKTVQSLYRTNIYLKPAERAALIDQVEDLASTLQNYARALTEEQRAADEGWDQPEEDEDTDQ